MPVVNCLCHNRKTYAATSDLFFANEEWLESAQNFVMFRVTGMILSMPKREHCGHRPWPSACADICGVCLLYCDVIFRDPVA